MSAFLWNAVVAFAVIALGFFSFLIGGTVSRAKSQKAKGDDHGYHTTVEDLVKIMAGSIVVLGASVLGFVVTAIAAPQYLMVPTSITGEPVGYLVNILGAAVLSVVVGAYLGVITREKLAGISRARSPVAGLIPAAGVLGVLALLVPRVAAETINITENLGPITDMLGWAGSSMAPALVVFIVGIIPVILILIAVRFCGGLLSEMLTGLREIFRFG